MKRRLITVLACALSTASLAQEFRLPDWEEAVESGFVLTVSRSGEPTFNCANNLDTLRSWRPSNPGFINVCPSLLGCNRAFFYREAQARCNLPQYPRAELDAVCDYPDFPEIFAERIASPPGGQREATRFLGDFGLRVLPSDFSATGPFRRWRIDAANEIWDLADAPDTWLQIGRGMIANIVEAIDDGFCEIEDGRGKKVKALQPAWDAAMEIAQRSGLGPYWAPRMTGQTPPLSPPPLGSPPVASPPLMGPFSFRPSSSTPRIRHHVAGDQVRTADGFQISGSVTLGNLDLDSECRSGCLLPFGWATNASRLDREIGARGWARWRSDLMAFYSIRLKPARRGDGWRYRAELKTGNPVRREIDKEWKEIVPGAPFAYTLNYRGGRVHFVVEHGAKGIVQISPAITLDEFVKKRHFALVLGSEDERFGPEVRFPTGSVITATMKTARSIP